MPADINWGRPLSGFRASTTLALVIFHATTRQWNAQLTGGLIEGVPQEVGQTEEHRLQEQRHRHPLKRLPMRLPVRVSCHSRGNSRAGAGRVPWCSRECPRRVRRSSGSSTGSSPRRRRVPRRSARRSSKFRSDVLRQWERMAGNVVSDTLLAERMIRDIAWRMERIARRTRLAVMTGERLLHNTILAIL